MKPIVLTVLILISAVLFVRPFLARMRLVRRGKGSLGDGTPGPRAWRWIAEVLLQSKVIRERPFVGTMHALVFWGFLAFALETADHFAEGYGFTILGHGAFRTGFAAFLNIVAVLVIVGIGSLAIRRGLLRPAALGKLSLESLFVAALITALMVTYLLPQLGVVDEASTAGEVNWWIHSLGILSFLPLIVTSKHLHLVLSPITTYYKDFRLAPLRKLDFENEEFGAEKLTDLHQHTLLGAFTCVECGRCQDHCPAHGTGKVLNPKALMLDLERGLLADPEQAAVSESVVDEQMLWQCTTCGACTDQCPVGIDQVVPIIELRRGLVANGSFPSTFNSLFKNLEGAGNPWAYQTSDGDEFLRDNEFPTFAAGEHEVLFWLGCLGRYDDAHRKVSLDLARIMNHAGVKWGVLQDERCTGDAARRAGNEFLFSMLAEQNVETLNAAAPKRIVATCPHCVRTLQEYADFGLAAGIEVVHHSTLIDELNGAGKLPAAAAGSRAVYHDPCYLSRYDKPAGVDTPRRVLAAAGTQVVEAERCGSRSFCCGAGGAMVFAEETAGTRINHERVEELMRTGADAVAVGCPFCRLMIQDGLKDKGHAEVAVKDIAQIVAERL